MIFCPLFEASVDICIKFLWFFEVFEDKEKNLLRFPDLLGNLEKLISFKHKSLKLHNPQILDSNAMTTCTRSSYRQQPTDHSIILPKKSRNKTDMPEESSSKNTQCMS